MLAAIVLALTLLGGACGGATRFDDGLSPAGDRLGTSGTATTSGAGAGSSAGAARAQISSSTSIVRGAQKALGRVSSTLAPAPTVSPSDLAIIHAAAGSPGAAAAIILQPTPARSIVVEVMEEPGAAANKIALGRVVSALRKYSGKPVSEVHTALPAGSPARRWDEAELDDLADRSGKVAQGGGQFVLRLVFVRGQNFRSGNILAVSFRGDTFAAFPDRYGSSSQQLITTVTMHELGHLLGLVDLYLNRGRADTRDDPAGEGHSSNPASVMYWAVDSSVIGALSGASSDRFDAQDERDLAAIRAGAPEGSNPR